ncbi:MAG: hypothetical protein MUC97_14005, partial [Bernardetiaceae bacterium]|nr:hypothetical protein [Bernardetiaceae bacterium]
ATGSDQNPGTPAQPLKTLIEAARRVSQATNQKATEVVVAEGLYVLTETALFKNNLPYTATERLVIRAEVLPDDSAWHPQRMPTIVTAVPLVKEAAGETGNGLQIEVSHATIQGFRFTGGLDYYYKADKQTRRTYPIWREGLALDDLLVTQCLFVGDEHVLPLQVGVIANGHGLVVDHCVFYKVRNPVVFWRAEGGTSNRNAMRHCLVYGAVNSGVWTVQTNGDDFEFRNNVIAHTRIAWIRERGSTRQYKVAHSLFAHNANAAAYGGGPAGSATLTDAEFLTWQDMRAVGKIELVMNQAQRDYLHLVKGAPGSDLQAGLFTKD